MGKFYSTLGTNDNLVYVVMCCILVAFTIEALHYGMKVYNALLAVRYRDEE